MQDNYVLILSGYDPTGNAGIIRDCLVCDQLQVLYRAFPTAITAQNDSQYFGAMATSDELFDKFSRSLTNKSLSSIKIGMLCDVKTVDNVCKIITKAKQLNPSVGVVWDPVIRTSSGGKLISQEGLSLALDKILSHTSVITPNAEEICLLIDKAFQPNLKRHDLVHEFYDKFKTNIYLKGGHLAEKNTDTYFDGTRELIFTGDRWEGSRRGTGCSLATAIACFIAKGLSLKESCLQAKKNLQVFFK